MLIAEFDPEKAWFKRFKVRLDLGFQGFKDLYPCKELFIPFKKPRKQELSIENKAQNKLQASERVMIEHSIGGLKRYRFLSDRLRARDVHFYDLTLGVCAALWNFTLKHPKTMSN